MKKSDAIEKLRSDIAAAYQKATADATELSGVDLEALGERCKIHKLGESVSGWKTPFPSDDPRSLLLEYQFRYYQDKSRFKFGLWSRQTGKDFTSEAEAVEDCLTSPRNEWMVAAPSERQALDSLDKAKEWAEAFDLKIADYQERREGSSSETLLKSAEVIFSNKSRIRAVPGKPDTVRGRSANVLLTEFDFFENPAATWRAILPSITNPLRGGEKKVRLVTTPNGMGGAGHKIWTKDDTARMQWSRHLVTIYHAVLLGLPVDIEQIREAMDDPEGFNQEFLCQFLDGSSILLPYDIIALAESFDATEAVDSLYWQSRGNPVFCGVDFGRSNDPTVCWSLEQIGDILWTREVLVLSNVTTPDQNALLRSRFARASRASVDYTGPGIGFGDYAAKEFGTFDPKGHEFGKIDLVNFTAGNKREMFPFLRRAFESPTRLRIPISTVIREDLHAMQQVITNAEYNYWAPRTRLGHSDRCTALALAVRAAGSGHAGVIVDPSTIRMGGNSAVSSIPQFIPRRLV